MYDVLTPNKTCVLLRLKWICGQCRVAGFYRRSWYQVEPAVQLIRILEWPIKTDLSVSTKEGPVLLMHLGYYITTYVYSIQFEPWNEKGWLKRVIPTFFSSAFCSNFSLQIVEICLDF